MCEINLRYHDNGWNDLWQCMRMVSIYQKVTLRFAMLCSLQAVWTYVLHGNYIGNGTISTNRTAIMENHAHTRQCTMSTIFIYVMPSFIYVWSQKETSNSVIKCPNFVDIIPTTRRYTVQWKDSISLFVMLPRLLTPPISDRIEVHVKDITMKIVIYIASKLHMLLTQRFTNIYQWKCIKQCISKWNLY